MTAALEATPWVLDVAVLGLPGAEDAPTVEFRDGNVSGSTGCNDFTGTFTKSWSKLAISPRSTTARAAGSAALAVEREYLARLGRVTSFRVKGDTLALLDDGGGTLLVYAAARDSIEGTWEITGYLMVSGHGFSSTASDSSPSAVFSADGSVSGSTGCNTYRGPYELDGLSISIGPLRTTRMAGPPERAEQATGILTSLTAASTFTLAPGTATLLNAAGQLVLSLAVG
ncbi:MAG TPA: META domain-containing protein [Acidimicrobiales bacterium]|jgi:heat shock protein HslJ